MTSKTNTVDSKTFIVCGNLHGMQTTSECGCKGCIRHERKLRNPAPQVDINSIELVI